MMVWREAQRVDQRTGIPEVCGEERMVLPGESRVRTYHEEL